MGDARQVSTEEGEAYARSLGIMFFETSSKSGQNIETLFRKAAESLTGFETGHVEEHKNEDVNAKAAFKLDGGNVEADK